jgi:hypothetical protein
MTPDAALARKLLVQILKAYAHIGRSLDGAQGSEGS